MNRNIDQQVVDDFADEWRRHDQYRIPQEELEGYFRQYFSLFPWDSLPRDAEGFDLGCGSGRWAYFATARVKHLHCIDPAAAALEVCRNNLSSRQNCTFHLAGVDSIPLPDMSQDFGYSLGVLHHVPDTQAGIASCVSKLKRGAPFLLYLYYAFDNRPRWFVALWKLSDALRRVVCVLPARPKSAAAALIAFAVYWPLSRAAGVLEKIGLDVSVLPLAEYRGKSLRTLLTDARDRFGTRLEQRFTRAEIRDMMEASGLHRISFSDTAPYWCAIGYRR